MKSVNVHVVSKFVLEVTNQSIKELNESNMEIYEGNEYYEVSIFFATEYYGIKNENDIEGNILANKLIDKKKLNKITIDYYSNYLEMLLNLYNKEIAFILFTIHLLTLFILLLCI